MIGPRQFRRDQREKQIDRLAVEGFEIDRALQPRENAENARRIDQLAMRDGDAIAKFRSN